MFEITGDDISLLNDEDLGASRRGPGPPPKVVAAPPHQLKRGGRAQRR
jgi:hypothetical protein